MAVDIEGNCRFYDLIRFRKMAKISPEVLPKTEEFKGHNSFRLLHSTCLQMT